MEKQNYGTFMNVADLKKEFAIKSTATLMRLVHKLNIPYEKITNKLILFPSGAVLAKIEILKNKAEKIYDK